MSYIDLEMYCTHSATIYIILILSAKIYIDE